MYLRALINALDYGYEKENLRYYYVLINLIIEPNFILWHMNSILIICLYLCIRVDYRHCITPRRANP